VYEALDDDFDLDDGGRESKRLSRQKYRTSARSEQHFKQKARVDYQKGKRAAQRHGGY
jgi:hypothetical protein